MRKAITIVGQLASVLLVLAAVISTDGGRRFVKNSLFSSAWASDDVDPAKAMAPEKSPCSAAETIATVKSLSGDNGTNPLAAAAKATFSLDAIRTVSSSPTQSICEARLTIKFNIPRSQPGPHALYTPPETEEAKALNDKIYQQLMTKVQEITYKIQKTDDGQFYVTVIPSEAEIIEQQNRQQQLQQQQYDQEQRSRAFEQESIERQEQYEQGLQEQWRQR